MMHQIFISEHLNNFFVWMYVHYVDVIHNMVGSIVANQNMKDTWYGQDYEIALAIMILN